MAKKQSQWSNRITGYGTQKASLFKANPLNWRKHPIEQDSALRGSLDTLGWVNVVIYNTVTGNLIDGHERVESALRNGDAEVPFITVDLSPEEEAQALLSLDTIAGMAKRDDEKVDALLDIVRSDNEDVNTFLDSLRKEPTEEDMLEEEDEEIRPRSMMRILISVPVTRALDVQRMVDQIASLPEVEVDYGATG